jgi:UMF1 family MFS transporter
MQTADKKTINGWAMYDWANSVYNLVITSTIFPAYFESVTGDGNPETGNDRVLFLGRSFVNTSLYQYALAVALLAVALVMPLLTSIADSRGNKKKFLGFFLKLGSISCACLWFFSGASTVVPGVGLMMLACFCFWSSYVFSNSYLPEIAAPEDRDRVSARGFAMGYIGSVILQCICFVFIFRPDLIGGTEDSIIQYEFSFLLTGLWWLLFGWYAVNRLPSAAPQLALRTNGSGWLTGGYRELVKVWHQLKALPGLKKFLGAFFFYNMGVQTVMLAATLYGKSELGIPTSNLIVAILLIQLVAIPGAFLISRLSRAIGNIPALMVVVACWILICIAGYFVPKGGIVQFYVLGTCVGFVMGGVQSLSRSTYSKLMPETKDTASFFSFYDVTEKLAIVLGLFSFGIINEVTGSQRNSVLALMIFFIIGLAGLAICRKSVPAASASTV